MMFFFFCDQKTALKSVMPLLDMLLWFGHKDLVTRHARTNKIYSLDCETKQAASATNELQTHLL